MERHYDSILDRNKRIMWQDDCYMDLHSTSSSLSSQAETAGMHNGVVFILPNRFFPFRGKGGGWRYTRVLSEHLPCFVPHQALNREPSASEPSPPTDWGATSLHDGVVLLISPKHRWHGVLLTAAFWGSCMATVTAYPCHWLWNLGHYVHI